MSRVTIEYTPLDEIQKWPRNPKQHDLEQIKASLRRHGYIDPIVRDSGSGRIVAGHGRSEALTQMHAAEEKAPDRVEVMGDGRWAVPVLGGIAFKDDHEAEAFLVASNRLVELGGWNDDMLSDILADLRSTQDGLIGVGFSDREISSLLSTTNPEKLTGKRPEDKLENFLVGEIKQMVFYFEDAEYTSALESIEEIMEQHGLETHTDAFIYLLDQHKASASQTH